MAYRVLAAAESDNASISPHTPSRASTMRMASSSPEAGSFRSIPEQLHPRYPSPANASHEGVPPESASLLKTEPIAPQASEARYDGSEHIGDDDADDGSSIRTDGHHSRKKGHGIATPSFTPTWQPFWLSPITLGILSIILLAFTVAMVAVLIYSEGNDGLANAPRHLHYLWRFGPTATFTLLTVFWSRVELQALRYTPWLKATGQPSQERDAYMLDYTSMLPPAVLLRSFRRKHSVVFLASSVTILLRVIIILSPSLFNPIFLDQTSSIKIQVLDSFNSGPLGYNMTGNTSTLPFYSAQAIYNFDMAPPFGLAKGIAYQTFGHFDGRANGSDLDKRATTEKRISTVVDGMFMNMTCLNLSNFSAPDKVDVDMPMPMPVLDLKLQFESCPETTISVNGSFSRFAPERAERNWWFQVWEMGSKITHDNGRPCSTLPQQHEQFVYWAAGVDEFTAKVSEVAGVICSPMTWLSKVRVEDDGASPNITVLVPGDEGYARPIPVETNVWDMVVESLSAKLQTWTEYVDVGGAYHTPSGPIFANYIFMGIAPKSESNSDDPTGLTRFIDNAMLRESILNLTSTMGPTVAHSLLREDNKSEVRGLHTETTERLMVSKGTGIAITILCLLSSCSAFWILSRSVLSPPTWSRDPATILGTMAILHNARETKPSSLLLHDAEQMDRLKKEWQNRNYTHMPLRIWVRLTFVVYGTGLIVGLLVCLNASIENEGLATIQRDSLSSSSMLWRSIPALAMVCIALYTSSSDAVTRSLASFSKLSSPSDSKGSHVSVLDVSLLDMLGLRALHYSLSLGLPAVGIMQVLAILCGFLITLSSVLFDVKITPKAAYMTVQPQSWFSDAAWTGESSRFSKDRVLGALLLMREVSNLTYPRHTWDDLALPTILIDDSDVEAAGGTIGDGSIVEIAVPAPKLVPQCERADDISVTVSQGIKDEGLLSFSLPMANITQSLARPNGTDFVSSETAFLASSINQEGDGENENGDWFLVKSFQPYYFNASRSFDATGVVFSQEHLDKWQLRTYIWGRASNRSSTELDFFSAWRCNYTWAEVTVDVTLIRGPGHGEYDIDQNHPPSVRSYSSGSSHEDFKPYEPSFTIPDFDGVFEPIVEVNVEAWPSLGLKAVSSGAVWTEYGSLFRPFGAFDLEDFGNQEKEQDILRAIQKNVGFFGAQMAAAMHRRGLNETSRLKPNGPDPDDIRPLKATVWDTQRQRLVQNVAITYVLVGIIGLVVSTNAWALVSALLIRRRQRGQKREASRWLVDFELRGVAPDGFSSIAKMEALLHGSNYASSMPEYPNWMTRDELKEHMIPGSRFRMGWFFDKRERKKVFTIGVVGDEQFEVMRD